MMAGLFDEPTIAYAQVAIERSVDAFPNGLTYGIPQRLDFLKAGHLVTVPLGKRNTPTSAWVLSIHNDSSVLPANTTPKQIYDCDRDAIILPEDLLELAAWMSQYYVAPIGPTLSTMLPGPVRSGTGLVTKQLVDLSLQIPADVKLNKQQQLIVSTLRNLSSQEKPIDKPTLAKLASLKSQSAIQTLLKRNILVSKQVTRVEANWIRHAKDHSVPVELTEEQTTVINAIQKTMNEGYSSHLLFGVTGSGKTEVYIRLIETALEKGGTALVLVPEISLTPQTAARLVGRFPDKQVAILHSSLTKSQRHQQWAMIAEGKADIVLGVRSAVFAPIPQGTLNIVIVDEEHEHSFKQAQAPRYHGRDVAIRRAWMSECPILLGSATPSMESWWNATVRKISTLHELKNRAPGLVVPQIELVNMKKECSPDGSGFALISERLNQAIRATLETNGQILLLLNRRGFAPWIACQNKTCDWMMQCDHCDSSMVFHRRKPLHEVGFVRCHHCAKEQRLPKQCPDCGGKVIQLGAGTQRIEALLRNSLDLPNHAIARLDSDVTTKANDLQNTLRKFGEGEIRILLGTQMIAKGLDFPNVKLVGVLNADSSIDLPDFRASERTYQLVSQVCGRCGRGAGKSIAIIQSHNPETPAIQLASLGNYVQFANAELPLRQSAALPPASRMARFIIRDRNNEFAKGRAEALVSRLEHLEHEAITIAPPIPCVIPRIADFFRYECVVSSPSSQSIQKFLAAARNQLTLGRELAVDVDPISLL